MHFGLNSLTDLPALDEFAEFVDAREQFEASVASEESNAEPDSPEALPVEIDAALATEEEANDGEDVRDPDPSTRS